MPREIPAEQLVEARTLPLHVDKAGGEAAFTFQIGGTALAVMVPYQEAVDQIERAGQPVN
jgi:hypothetical protein